jgi:hypothetical protein
MNYPSSSFTSSVHYYVVQPISYTTPQKYVKRDFGPINYVSGSVTVDLPFPKIVGNSAYVTSSGVPADSICQTALGLDELGIAKRNKINYITNSYLDYQNTGVSASFNSISVNLAADASTQGLFTSLVTLWQEGDNAQFNTHAGISNDFVAAQSASLAFNSEPASIFDKQGNAITGSIGDIRGLIANYGSVIQSKQVTLRSKILQIQNCSTIAELNAIT